MSPNAADIFIPHTMGFLSHCHDLTFATPGRDIKYKSGGNL